MRSAGIIAMTFPLSVISIVLLYAGMALAHCDTMNGPIIPEAKAALEKGDVTPMLQWIRKDDEAEIRTAFSQAVAVRSQGPQAKHKAFTTDGDSSP